MKIIQIINSTTEDLYLVKTQKDIGKNTYFETWYMFNKELIKHFNLSEISVKDLIGKDLILTEAKKIEYKKIPS